MTDTESEELIAILDEVDFLAQVPYGLLCLVGFELNRTCDSGIFSWDDLFTPDWLCSLGAGEEAVVSLESADRFHQFLESLY